MSSVKQKLSINSLGKKCQASRDLEKGLSNSNVTEQYGIPRNTILTWVKNKSEYFVALEQSSIKRKKLRSCYYKRVDHVVFKYLLCKRIQNIPVDVGFIKTRLPEYETE